MKRILLFFVCLFYLVLTFSARYKPISLDLIQPTTKTVEIKGQVKSPGVYTIKYDATVEDIISQAGGLLDNADVSDLSLVRDVADQEVIVIGERKENENKISLNSATVDELDSLPGIGPSIAQKIIEYRETKPFSTIEEVMEVKGIKEGIFNKIKDYIVL